ncbi:MAG: integral rane protein [Candidatus Saccharibacteria bacterium]|nr:integral rane protein [Candidatus Saccharibacteria bacterium]
MVKKQSKKQPANQDRATVSLIFGVVSMFSFLFWFFGILFGVLAIGFGVGAIRAKQDMGRSVAGIVTGASGVLMALAITLLFAVVTPKDTESQTDKNRTDDANNIALQISNIIANHRSGNAIITPKDISLGGFKVIKAVASTGKPTKTQALLEAGENCDGIKKPNDYAVKVLMDNSSEYCTGYVQN